jgi:hypothetical protein
MSKNLLRKLDKSEISLVENYVKGPHLYNKTNILWGFFSPFVSKEYRSARSSDNWYIDCWVGPSVRYEDEETFQCHPIFVHHQAPAMIGGVSPSRPRTLTLSDGLIKSTALPLSALHFRCFLSDVEEEPIHSSRINSCPAQCGPGLLKCGPTTPSTNFRNIFSRRVCTFQRIKQWKICLKHLRDS